MKRLFALYALATYLALSQSQVGSGPAAAGNVNGVISGGLTGEDGSTLQGGSIALHRTTLDTSRIGLHQADWTAVTDSSGVFLFTGLPAGDYTVCPRVPNSTWLNPCDWNLPIPIASISPSAATASVSTTLKRGVAVVVRINDPNGLLAQYEGKTPGGGILLEVSDGAPASFFRWLPIVSQDSTGRNHQIAIPFNTPLTLFLYPTFFHVNDATGKALTADATTKIPLLAAPGQQIALVVLTIIGHD